MLGKKKALLVSEFLHLVSASIMIWFVIEQGGGWLMWIGAGIFTGLLLYQHTLVKPNNLKRVNLAFFTTNGIASVIFAGFAIADLLLL
jgi:4-hydroxybenzoate polyprenyltransferase